MEKKLTKYRIAVLGCGAIFNRHLSAINANKDNFELIGVFDPDTELLQKQTQQLKVKLYKNENEVYLDNEINCIVILSPSHLHFLQAMKALKHKKNVILEKPATFLAYEIDELELCAKVNDVNIFCILQVRLNPSVIIVKQLLEQQLLGKIRGVSLIQRWQRPISYFSGWRGSMKTGGGILREFAIHYLDVLQYLVGMPSVLSASFYNTKFIDFDTNDTIYALLNFKHFGGSVEITISSEPKNLECSLSIMGEYGFIKLGGKSLDEISTADFLSNDIKNQFNLIEESVMAKEIKDFVNQGSCPHHPELYKQISIKPKLFTLNQTFNVIKLIEEIYKLRK
ncbi:MAG TPA: Gfo/Idh/MocA family oxidoreductase [Burkholderiales bacterium]|mgnify:CR=1 FL=1|nr:Gfo/Idh/MocA family oxidoreductase [Burkholderiales bacterium]